MRIRPGMLLKTLNGAPAGTARDRTSEKQRKKVYQYTKDNVLVKVWDGVNLTREYGFDTSSVSCCCNGTRKTHKGYKWSFEPL